MEKDSINIIGPYGNILEGNHTGFLQMMNFVVNNDLEDSDNYEQLQNWLDLDEFLDYMIVEIFYGNKDWPQNNVKFWNTNDPNSRWRCMLYDLDFSSNRDVHCSYTENTLERVMSDDHPSASVKILFKELLKNEDFERMFLLRFALHLNTTFEVYRVLEKIDDYQAVYEPEIDEHIKRWGYPSNKNKWYEHIDSLRSFAINRPCYITDFILEEFDLSEDEFFFNCNVSSEETVEINYTIAPNPASDKLYISSDILTSKETSISIVDISGTQVYLEEGCGLYSRKEIDVSKLKSGVYILKIDSSNYSKHIKFVITR